MLLLVLVLPFSRNKLSKLCLRVLCPLFAHGLCKLGSFVVAVVVVVVVVVGVVVQADDESIVLEAPSLDALHAVAVQKAAAVAVVAVPGS